MHTRNQPVTVSHFDPAESSAGRPEIVFVLGAGAVSGAIMGFLFAVQIPLSVGVFAGVSLGLVAGWWARGAAA